MKGEYKMSKFEKFYDGMCRRVIPLMLIGLIFVVVEIINIFSGKALRTIDMVALIGGLVESYGVAIFWFVLTLIQRHKDKKFVRMQSGGGIL